MADTPAAKPFPIPLSYFGIALGTAGLGMSWRYAATVGLAPAWPGESLLALAGTVWMLLMLAWLTKFLAFPSGKPSGPISRIWCSAASSA